MQIETDATSEVATLLTLNSDYIRAVQASDVAWFEKTLAADFRCSLPDGSLIDRQHFLERAAQPVDISRLQAHDVEVRTFGDTAVIHARTTFALADGRAASGRYTDVWLRQQGRWVVIAAHVTRLSN